MKNKNYEQIECLINCVFDCFKQKIVQHNKMFKPINKMGCGLETIACASKII